MVVTHKIRWLDSLHVIPAENWDALHDGRNPFVCHAFLSGLEQYGCLRPDWGWTAHHPTLWDGDRLVAAAPGYIKYNSHGEFVFDHAWANVYAQYGFEYYPKWLCAVPYSPVTGPRLLARDDAARRDLLREMVELVRARQFSSAHVNFYTAAEEMGFDDDWLLRLDVQYHWHNPGHWRTFDDYLAAMNHKHRKAIRQERRKVREAGVRFRIVHGNEASAAEIEAVYGFYQTTFIEYGNTPTLSLDFLFHLAAAMPQQLVLILAEYNHHAIAGAICLRGGDTLYGRYWGSRVMLPGLHFETCYYQGIEYCLREGLRVFEPGAQGEHKIARGFLPVPVRSRHWLAEPGFRAPLRAWCREEAAVVQRHARLLHAHSPFRATSS